MNAITSAGVAAIMAMLDVTFGWIGRWRDHWLRRGDPATDCPETQDDFTTSMARWGYLHDQNN